MRGVDEVGMERGRREETVLEPGTWNWERGACEGARSIHISITPALFIEQGRFGRAPTL
jgi:hypothetical protein